MEAHLKGTGDSGVRGTPPIYAPRLFGLQVIIGEHIRLVKGLAVGSVSVSGMKLTFEEWVSGKMA
jgi:hypothetical protein